MACEQSAGGEGIYVCAKCGYELFSSHSKYAHSSPWPAFTETIHADSVVKRPEHNRPEALKVSCGKCGSGLGHEFLNDGPKRGQSRSSLKFIPKGEAGEMA
uniref:Methionine-R-sulfoxide reductase B1 n=1 Tax=Jaculus jaculus TaxID=51337 RepID=A0A8C5LED9_JACJA